MSEPSKAQMSQQEVESLLRFTALAEYFSTICILLPADLNTHFYKNLEFLREELEFKILQNDPDILVSEAQAEVDAVMNDALQEARALIDERSCEGPHQEALVKHYSDVAKTPPPRFSALVLMPDAATSQQDGKQPVQ